MFNLKGISYKQTLLIRGISFSLILLFSTYVFKTSIMLLLMYIVLLTLRYVFSYNLDPYKFKILPMFHFSDYIFEAAKKLTKEEIRMVYGTEKDTQEFKLKTSDQYTYSLLTVSFVSFCLVVISSITVSMSVINYIQENMTLDLGLMFVSGLLIILLVMILLFFVNLKISVNKARVKDNLNS